MTASTGLRAGRARATPKSPKAASRRPQMVPKRVLRTSPMTSGSSALQNEVAPAVAP